MPFNVATCWNYSGYSAEHIAAHYMNHFGGLYHFVDYETASITMDDLIDAESGNGGMWCGIIDSISGEVIRLARCGSTDPTQTFNKREIVRTRKETDKDMVKLSIRRKEGKLVLSVDAKGLHETLDALGAPVVGDMYAERPRAETSVVNSANWTLSSDTLLKRQYPAEFNLSACFTSGNPPTFAQLNQVCESAYDQVRRILDHYQPIDISIEIHKKVVK